MAEGVADEVTGSRVEELLQVINIIIAGWSTDRSIELIDRHLTDKQTDGPTIYKAARMIRKPPGEQ